ncbi:MAG: PTS system nitrogen regulatory IIA component [Hyphomicrobiaceae bacterium]|jgi:PTS system nitrogen regulatory IIA component
MRIREILEDDRILLEVENGTKEEILSALAEPLSRKRHDIDHAKLASVLVEREQASSTAIADGIAIPHGRMPIGDEVLCTFGRNVCGVDFDSVDGQPTRLFFMLVSPMDGPSLHVRWLGHIAGLLKNPALRKSLVDATSRSEILEILASEEEAQGKAS